MIEHTHLNLLQVPQFSQEDNEKNGKVIYDIVGGSQKPVQGRLEVRIGRHPREGNMKLAGQSPREAIGGISAPFSVSQDSLTAQNIAQRKNVPSSDVFQTYQGLKGIVFLKIPEIKTKIPKKCFDFVLFFCKKKIKTQPQLSVAIMNSEHHKREPSGLVCGECDGDVPSNKDLLRVP